MSGQTRSGIHNGCRMESRSVSFIVGCFTWCLRECRGWSLQSDVETWTRYNRGKDRKRRRNMADTLIAPENEPFPNRKRWTRRECEFLVANDLLIGRYELIDGEIIS